MPPHTHTHTWSSGHTHTHTHTPGAVDTHTHTPHLEQWTHTHNTHTPGAVDTHTHTHTPGAVDTHTHTHTWSSGQSTLRRPGSSWGFGALLKGLTSVVDNSCRSREPTTSDYKSSALSIRPRLPLDYNLQLYCKLLHIQCGSVKSNAFLIKIHKHIKSYSFASEIPSNVRFFSEI